MKRHAGLCNGRHARLCYGRHARLCNTPSKMDEENHIDDKLKRKRELANARVKKYRIKKRIESQQLKASMQENKELKENNAERKRALAKERSRRYRERKRLNVLKSVHHVVHDSQILKPTHGNPPLVLKNQRTTIHDSQFIGTSTNMDQLSPNSTLIKMELKEEEIEIHLLDTFKSEPDPLL